MEREFSARNSTKSESITQSAQTTLPPPILLKLLGLSRSKIIW